MEPMGHAGQRMFGEHGLHTGQHELGTLTASNPGLQVGHFRTAKSQGTHSGQHEFGTGCRVDPCSQTMGGHNTALVALTGQGTHTGQHDPGGICRCWPDGHVNEGQSQLGWQGSQAGPQTKVRFVLLWKNCFLTTLIVLCDGETRIAGQRRAHHRCSISIEAGLACLTTSVGLVGDARSNGAMQRWAGGRAVARRQWTR
jgi:hypothetical protein